MTHDVQVVQKDDCCEPDCPAPTPQQAEMCEGTLNGSITGTVMMECCCPQLRTRTFHLNIGPQTEGALIAYLQATTVSYESNGYLVLGHSVTDIGAGWKFSLTIGWYA